MGNEKNKKSQMDLYDLADMVDHSARKITFLKEFVGHKVPDDEIFSEKQEQGSISL